MMKNAFAAAVLLLGSTYSLSVAAGPIASAGTVENALGPVATPAAVSTSGCADAGFCTLQELVDGGSISAGGVNFANFDLPFQFNLGADTDGDGVGDSFDMANVHVTPVEVAGGVILVYNHAPFGFGGPLPSLVFAEGSALWNITYDVSTDAGTFLIGAGINSFGVAGTSDADYSIDMEMLLNGGDLADLFAFGILEDNAFVDFGFDDIALFAAMTGLSVENAFVHIASEGLSLLNIFQQLFLTEQVDVPAPSALFLMLIGLAALRRRRA